MGIDRVGKGGAPPTAPEAQGSTAVDKKSHVEKVFTVDRPEEAGRAAKAEAAGTLQEASPLARLRAGEIDVNGYVDLKVEEATKNLEGLTTAELDDIKTLLRDQLATDPGLTDLVRAATGHVPEAPDD